MKIAKSGDQYTGKHDLINRFRTLVRTSTLQLLCISIPMHVTYRQTFVLYRKFSATISAAALCASPATFEIGVTQVNANFAASQSGMDITEYFPSYQAWVTIPMAITAAALHFFWQRRCDLK